MSDPHTDAAPDQLALRAVFVPFGEATPPDLLDGIGAPVRIPAELILQRGIGPAPTDERSRD